jgi:hypothetical protein
VFEHRSTQRAPPHKTQRHEPPRETLAVFAYGVIVLAANSFNFDRALLRRRLSCVAGLRSALRLGQRVADRLGLRIADRLGQHLMQLSLGRGRRFCHFATISLSTSQLP